jgi:hypothetical protein
MPLHTRHLVSTSVNVSFQLSNVLTFNVGICSVLQEKFDGIGISRVTGCLQCSIIPAA